MGKAGIAVVEHADMPGPRHALEHRRKAVHGEAGIILPYDHRTELVSDQATHRTHADVPGNVTFEFSFPEAKVLQATRQIISGVIGNDDQWRSAARIDLRDGLWFIRCEK